MEPVNSCTSYEEGNKIGRVPWHLGRLGRFTEAGGILIPPFMRGKGDGEAGEEAQTRFFSSDSGERDWEFKERGVETGKNTRRTGGSLCVEGSK